MLSTIYELIKITAVYGTIMFLYVCVRVHLALDEMLVKDVVDDDLPNYPTAQIHFPFSIFK